MWQKLKKLNDTNFKHVFDKKSNSTKTLLPVFRSIDI